MKIQGKTFVVTGGGNGMGRELVLLMLAKGAKVAAVDINEESLKETVHLSGSFHDSLTTQVLDITNRAAVMSLPGIVIQQHAAVDGVINNAGIIQKFVKINDLDFPEIERVFNINFWGMLNVTKAFLPYLLKRPEAHIVNVSSMGGYLPVPGQTAYGASKAAVKLFTEGLHSELLSTRVHVSVVFPGAIATHISANSGVTLDHLNSPKMANRIKMLPPAEAANIIVAGIEKNKYHILVGQDAKWMDFLCRLMPERAARLIYSQMRSLLPA